VALAGTVGASAWTTRAQADGEAVPQTESAVLELVKQRAALISATLPNVAEDLRRHCSDLSGFTLRPVDIPLATAIDHTLHKPQATGTDIQKLCEEAAKHKFGAVCVNGSNVPRAVAHLRSLGAQQVKVAAVVGFPLGASSAEVKFVEAFQAIQEVRGRCVRRRRWQRRRRRRQRRRQPIFFSRGPSRARKPRRACPSAHIARCERRALPSSTW
jgi:hypothetical protein